MNSSHLYNVDYFLILVDLIFSIYILNSLRQISFLWPFHTDGSDSYSASYFDMGSIGMYSIIIGIGHFI